MLKSVAFALVLCGASVAHAGSFFFFDSSGNTTFGTTYPSGGYAADSYGRSYQWIGNVQPAIVPNYGYQPYYQPMYLNRPQPMYRTFRGGF